MEHSHVVVSRATTTASAVGCIRPAFGKCARTQACGCNVPAGERKNGPGAPNRRDAHRAHRPERAGQRAGRMEQGTDADAPEDLGPPKIGASDTMATVESPISPSSSSSSSSSAGSDTRESVAAPVNPPVPSSHDFFARLERERTRQRGIRDRLSSSRIRTGRTVAANEEDAQESPQEREKDSGQTRPAVTGRTPVHDYPHDGCAQEQLVQQEQNQEQLMQQEQQEQEKLLQHPPLRSRSHDSHGSHPNIPINSNIPVNSNNNNSDIPMNSKGNGDIPVNSNSNSSSDCAYAYAHDATGTSSVANTADRNPIGRTASSLDSSLQSIVRDPVTEPPSSSPAPQHQMSLSASSSSFSSYSQSLRGAHDSAHLASFHNSSASVSAFHASVETPPVANQSFANLSRNQDKLASSRHTKHKTPLLLVPHASQVPPINNVDSEDALSTDGDTIMNDTSHHRSLHSDVVHASSETDNAAITDDDGDSDNVTDSIQDNSNNNGDHDEETDDMPRLSSIVSEDVTSKESSKISFGTDEEEMPKLSSFETSDAAPALDDEDLKSRNTSSSSVWTNETPSLVPQRTSSLPDCVASTTPHDGTPTVKRKSSLPKTAVKHLSSFSSVDISDPLSPRMYSGSEYNDSNDDNDNDSETHWSVPQLTQNETNDRSSDQYTARDNALNPDSHQDERVTEYITVKKVKPDYHSPVSRYPQSSSPSTGLLHHHHHHKTSGKHNHTTTTMPVMRTDQQKGQRTHNSTQQRPRQQPERHHDGEVDDGYHDDMRGPSFASQNAQCDTSPKSRRYSGVKRGRYSGLSSKRTDTATYPRRSSYDEASRRQSNTMPTSDVEAQKRTSQIHASLPHPLNSSQVLDRDDTKDVDAEDIDVQLVNGETWVYCVALFLFVAVTVGILFSVLFLFGANGRRADAEGDVQVKVRTFLSRHSSEHALRDPGSPQALALDWMLQDERSQNRLDDDDRFVQRYILAVLWHSTTVGGEKWHRTYGFLTGTSECEWNIDPNHGVVCNDDNHVVGIHLASNNLAGALPIEISHLSTLKTLNLENNTLIGAMPDFRYCDNLETLSLAHNFIRGNIALHPLPTLATLDLSFNQLSGNIPSNLGEMIALQRVNIGYNHLTGSLDMLGAVPQLRSLNVTNNLLGGDLSSAPILAGGTGSTLELIDISSNRFEGSLPTTIGDLTQLMVLDFSDNFVTGSIPTEVGTLPLLETVIGDRNVIQGEFPWDAFIVSSQQQDQTTLSSSASATVLRHVSMKHNYIQGRLPPDYGTAFPSLEVVDFENNHLTGELSLPPSPSLSSLQLARNQLTGSIPMSIEDLYRLTMLDLSSNRLTGVIPVQSLSRLPRLVTLFLHDNLLQGNIEPMCTIASTITADCDNLVECDCCTICF